MQAMLESMTGHEFYCSNYACKEQPHIDGYSKPPVCGCSLQA